MAACGELEEGDDGVVVGSDGDPFPSWPQDHPGLADGAPGAGYDARAAAAETLRAFGNEAFREGDWARADAKYAKALRYLSREGHAREAETLAEADAARRQHVALGVPLLLNAAAAKLRLRDGRGAAAACDELFALQAAGAAPSVLGGGGAPQAGHTAKALYRRGAARALCREFEGAEEDLVRAAAMLAGDAAAAAPVLRELARVREAAAARKGRARAAFAAAFGGGGGAAEASA